MSNFIDEYKKLLIIQYADKEKAKAHIEAILSKLEEVYNLSNILNSAFDLDTAVGKQLDILGKISGISRKVPLAIPKKYFGFNDYENSYSFGDKFASLTVYPFREKFELPYTDTELNDYDYRFFMRAKISKNYAKATMIDENKLSVQDIIDYLFKSKAHVVDNKDMSLSVYVDKTYDFDTIRYIMQMDLIPRPQGVRIKELISYDVRGMFGFSNNPNSKGFGDKFGEAIDSYFAEREYL